MSIQIANSVEAEVVSQYPDDPRLMPDRLQFTLATEEDASELERHLQKHRFFNGLRIPDNIPIWREGKRIFVSINGWEPTITL